MIPGMPAPPTRLSRLGWFGASFAGVLAVLAWMIRPLNDGPAAVDAAASVLYFDRIVAGRHLEAWVNTTPKPLLTVVYGSLHELTGGWVGVSIVTVLATAAGIVMAAELVRRFAGVEAAVFALVSLVGLVSLAYEASEAFGLPWAFAFWCAAGLALARPAPAYGWAGAFLLLGGLVRPETFVFLAVATVVLAWRAIRGPRPADGAWRIMVGWLAIGFLCLHDLLLTGDPLWWTTVGSHSVELLGGRPASPARIALNAVLHVRPLTGLAVAAGVGMVVLVRRRTWLPILGILAMGAGVAAFCVFLAWRHLAILAHYYDPIDLAVVLAAAVGVGTAVQVARRHVMTRSPGLPPAIERGGGVLVVIVAAIVLANPFAPRSSRALSAIGRQAAEAQRLTLVRPELEAALAPLRPVDPGGPGPTVDRRPADAVLFAPAFQVNCLAVDLDLPISRVMRLEPDDIDLAGGYPRVGSVVYVDRLLGPASITPATSVLLVSEPTEVAGVRIVPVSVDPTLGVWVVRIEAGVAP